MIGDYASSARNAKAAGFDGVELHFIGNPDLVRRPRDDLPPAASSTKTYYQGGRRRLPTSHSGHPAEQK